MSNRELLRITVPNMTCHGIDFMRDGKSIISGNVAIVSGVVGVTSGSVGVISGSVSVISGNLDLIRLWLGCRLWLWTLAFSFNVGLSGGIPWSSLPTAHPSLLRIQPLFGVPCPTPRPAQETF